MLKCFETPVESAVQMFVFIVIIIWCNQLIRAVNTLNLVVYVQIYADLLHL